MRSSQLYVIVFLINLSIIGGSCNEDDPGLDLTATTWKVEKIQRVGSTSFEETDSTYIIRFNSDLTVAIALDINQCSGLFSVPETGKIQIDNIACTEACCDSDFAGAIVQILPGINEYFILGDKLHLQGDGRIVLQRAIHEACYDKPPTNEMCAAYFERWFYNENTCSCEKIAYSGCSVYGFESQEECEACKGT